MQYYSNTWIWVRIVLFFILSWQVFLSPRTMDFFTVTTVNNCLFHQTYWFTYCPRVWPIVHIAVTIGNSISSLCVFTMWQVAGWQRSMRKPPHIRMQNGPPFTIDRSSPGGDLRGGVFHKCSNIYIPPHPKPPQIRGC